MIRRMSPLIALNYYFHIRYANILTVFPIGCVELNFVKCGQIFPEIIGCVALQNSHNWVCLTEKLRNSN